MRVFLLCLFLCVFNVHGSNIDDKVMSYFNSPTFKSFQTQWKKYQSAIENSLELMLKETYGEDGMNIYVRRMADPHKLGDGVLVSDNIVMVLLKDLYLTQLPHLILPEVSFDLASNVLQVEAKVSRLFIQADYQLFRNLSDIAYTAADMDPYKTSPFNFQQVKSDGEVTIVAEDCNLSGFVLTSLNDQTVSLGQDTIKLTSCKFYVEITTPGVGSPPVIAPYFSKEQGLKLELLVSKPIRDELLPRLQGSVYTCVNTSSMFGDLLPKIRRQQQDLFKKTSAHFTQVTRNINKVTMNENHGIEKLKDIYITWSDKNNAGALQEYFVALKDMTITGLDSAYSAQNGGPHVIQATKISDSIRFNALQIRGSFQFGVDGAESQSVFYGEILDVTSCMTLVVSSRRNPHQEKFKPSSDDNRFELFGWRNLDLHAPDLPEIYPHSLISGVILNELPNLVIRRLSRSYNGDVGDEGEGVEHLLGKESAEGGGAIDVDGNNNENDTVQLNVVIEHQDDDENDDKEKLAAVNKVQDKNNNTNMFNNQMLNESMFNQQILNTSMFEKNDMFGKPDKPMFDGQMLNTSMFEKNDMFGKPDKPMFDGQMFDGAMFGGNEGNKGKLTAEGGGNRGANGGDAVDYGAGGSPNIIVKRRKKDIKATEYAGTPYNFEYDTACPSVIRRRCNGLPGTHNVTRLQIEYRLYRRGNEYDYYILLDKNALPVDPKNIVDLANAPLKVITHGWKASADDPSVAWIKDAYLKTRYINIIAVNWGVMADTCYCRAVVNVKIVGKSLARFLDAVNMRYGVGGGDMHLIGHSLGAHVVGIAAWRTSFVINRVTGLDPAFPLYEFPILVRRTERIDSSCANFVDIIHTCGGVMGFARPIGHLDFYPNGGMFMQPNCEDSPEPWSCSHARSYDYYVETIYTKEAYPSFKCNSWNSFLDGKCDFNNFIYMGDAADPYYIGKYYLHIN